jgi:hypothetical protein
MSFFVCTPFTKHISKPAVPSMESLWNAVAKARPKEDRAFEPHKHGCQV